jgi:hypothetical protein
MQSVEVSPAKPGEGGIRRNADYPNELTTNYDPNITTLYEMFK